MTPHIESKKEEIAETVIMPGDPLRAKYIAENFLKDYKLVNQVRNIYAYTGYYKEKKITIMASGMGMPSIGIYSYELFKFYDVKNIIRIGTFGSYTKELELYDLLLVTNAYSDSSYALVQNNNKNNILNSSDFLNEVIINTAEKINQKLKTGTIYSSDVFYKEKDNYKELYDKYNCLGVEMESFALFSNALILGKKAACLLTVSDNFETKEQISSVERQNSLNKMITLALETALEL